MVDTIYMAVLGAIVMVGYVGTFVYCIYLSRCAPEVAAFMKRRKSRYLRSCVPEETLFNL